VKGMRRATTAVALTLWLSAPAVLLGQGTRSTGPNADTPRLLVAVFTSKDLPSGVQTADAIRNRVSNTANVRTLYVIPKEQIVSYLESSGYKPDSSLGASDLKELAKLLRADEVLGGTVTRTAAGYRIEPRLMLARDPAMAQPLPPIESNNTGDAARQIERSLQEARKQIADNRACENAIRDNKHAVAIAAANAGIAKYPQATIARLCLANAFSAMKAPPDSILRVTREIRQLDPRNSMARRYAYTAHKAKGDNESAVRVLVELFGLEPNDPSLQSQVITELAQLGKPDVAIPIVEELIAKNPGDPQLLRQKWLLLLNAGQNADSVGRPAYFARALTAGEEMAKVDSMLGDSIYFGRQIAAASQSSTPARAIEFAAKATQKYPNSAEFWMLKGNAERKAGQLQMAEESVRRALSIDAKYSNGNLLLAQINLDLGRPDTAVAIARRAVTAGEDGKTWGTFLLVPTQTAFKTAQDSKAVADYEKALSLAQESDRLAPSATSKFFIGVSSFSIGIDALQNAQKPKSCVLAKKAQEMFLLTQMNMAQGGSVDANVARQILGYVAQYAPPADQMVKQYCK
jgi:tetratricopeptide (TPR) repeat protein